MESKSKRIEELRVELTDVETRHAALLDERDILHARGEGLRRELEVLGDFVVGPPDAVQAETDQETVERPEPATTEPLLTDRIVAAVAELGRVRPQDLARRLQDDDPSVESSAVRALLSQLVQAGRLHRPARGLYEVPGAGLVKAEV